MNYPNLTEAIINFYRAGCDKETALTQGELFWLYHSSRGWKIKGKPIVRWDLAAATWRRIMKKEKVDNEHNISAPKVLQPCKILKLESDKDYYRVESNGVLYEFDRNTPPNGNHRLAWRNHFRGYVRE